MIRHWLPLIVSAPLLGSGLAKGQDAPDVDEASSIKALRMQSNEAIAAHDIPAIVSFFDEAYQITTSVGSMSQGVDEEIEGLTALFEARPDVNYVRTPEVVEISRSNPLAKESGSWVGTWTTANGPVRTGGSYTAMWRKVDGRWRIRAELFVALFCEGRDCP
jgi:ketosteroid isomerase-like protein